MTRSFVLSCVALSTLLAACTAGSTVLRTGDACGVGGSQSVLGTDRRTADAFAAQRNASGLPARVAGPNDAITFDVNPARLNLILDGGGTVRELACG